MEIQEILTHCDHTILSQTATWEDVRRICDEGYRYNTASVCIPPSYVHAAEHYVGDQVKICTVIGFPNGYNTLKAKVFETKQAIDDGASEIDVVINVGALKAGDTDFVKRELQAVRSACRDYILKVIIEACLLTEEEKIAMCKIITDVGADYIKTSTGFSTGGATFDDVVLFSKHIGPNVKIKAAGGIRTVEAAEKFLSLGCDRLGTSALVKVAQSMENSL